MKGFKYFMPADTFFGRNCIMENREVFAETGKKALIVTGRSSAKKNGAQADVTAVLEAVGVEWTLFDEIKENPDVETIERAAKQAVRDGAEFIIGIGGGSPMDGAKAIAVLAKNPDAPTDILFTKPDAQALPVIEIPTTAGTGSEVTQYSIMTLHEKRTKQGICQKVFAKAAFLDSKYMEGLSPVTTNNTGVDALTHLIESYLNVNSNFVSERIVEAGFSLFKEFIPAMRERKYSEDVRDKMLLASSMAGVAIAQTSTSIPHLLGYFLTYEKGIPHGRANGLVTEAYVRRFPKGNKKVEKMLNCLGMSDVKELGELLRDVLDTPETFTKEDIAYYAKRAMESPQKIATFPYPLTQEDIENIYIESLMK